MNDMRVTVKRVTGTSGKSRWFMYDDESFMINGSANETCRVTGNHDDGG